MANMTEFAELLFFDTFAHDNTEEINLDLVQFPKPVYITEVRIIPLGARVQADFPGGVRLGATNPSQFKIEFFVNDLGKPGASTFESVGGFEYNQNGCINLECIREDTIRKIPTDGLVLRGWYTTITLAVYGTLTKNITEQLIQPVVNPPIVPNQPNLVEPQQILPASHLEPEWPNENIAIPVEYDQPAQSYQQAIYNQQDPYQGEYQDYYSDAPKDPRNYHVSDNSEWNKVCSRQPEVVERERDRGRDLFEKTGSLERDHRNESEKRDRDRDKMYSRERQPRDYRGSPRDSDHDRSKYEGSDREKSRSDRSSYKHEESSRRSYGRSEDNKERENDRKRPRTPPLMSPKRPKTPHQDVAEKSQEIEKESAVKMDELPDNRKVCSKNNTTEEKEQLKQNASMEETKSKLDVEEFEPILSDEDILDDNEHYQDNNITDDFNDAGDYDDPVRLFVPGAADLIPYRPKAAYEILENSLKIAETLKITVGICDDYFKSSITRYTVEEFGKLNTEIKEEFIHLCEKLPSIIGCARKFVTVAEIHEKISNFDVSRWNELDKEVAEQVRNVFETTGDWLKVALNYELANSQDQPIYKIRHIKCGLKVAQFVFESEIFIRSLLKEKFDVYYVLLELYRKEYMAPSLKLMILKALDTSLSHRVSMETFLGVARESLGERNGLDGGTKNSVNYKTLLELLRHNSSVRIKFSLCSILKKINLYEIFSKFEETIAELKNVDSNVTTAVLNVISKILEQILQYLENGQYFLTQPRRFLPVASQFEIAHENVDSKDDILIEFFKTFNFVECLVFLLTHSFLSNLPIVKIPVLEVFDSLSKSRKGVEYLAERCDAVNVLLKLLLQSDEEVQYSVQNGLDVKSHSLGVALAFKLKAQYHVTCLLDIGATYNFDLSSPEVLEELLSLYCLTLSANGKVELSNVLGMTENFKAIAQFVNVKEKLESQFSKLKKSPGILYVIDLFYVVLTHSSNVQLLEKFSKEIIHVLNFNGQPEVCTNKLNSLNGLISPIINNKTLSYDNILPLVEIIRRDVDNLIDKPEEIVTCLRMIYNYGVSKRQSVKSSNPENPFDNFVELKYKHVILQLFSLDGVSLVTKMLQRLCEHYKQPGVHSSGFMSQQGLVTVEIALPAVFLLQKMLTYAIQCRNTSFKDLTAVPVLLQTYNLMTSYALDSAHRGKCELVKEAIVDTLLVYTQPISDEVHEKDTLNKTLWSMMCKEVIQYISQAPYTFVSGLLVLSELLPLPLPIQTNDELQENEASWTINLRKLWAAHLHPHSAAIQDFVNKLCTTSCQSLLNLLRRICVQISDLAANSALMISRGVLDAVFDEISTGNNNNKDWICGAHAARLLNFLACLVTHNTLKCAVLSLLQGGSGSQADQKYSGLVAIFVQILRKNDQGTHHVQCQECIFSVVQSFCDVEVSLLQNPQDLTSNVYLSNALPVRNHLVSFIEVITEHLSSNNSFVTYLPAVRTILLLTEHDYGFYHLKEAFSKKPGLFHVMLDKIAKNFSKDNPECVSVLNTLMEFFYVSLVKEEVVGPLTYSPRSMRYNLGELKGLIGFKSDDGSEKQPLEVLRETLRGIAAEDTTFEGLLEKLTGLITLLNTPETDGDETHTEPLLPSPEPLLAQFSRRLVYNCTDTFNERLTANYWLSLPASEETEAEIENTTADLAELCKQNLSDEYNLIREIEILCRISSNNMAEKEKKNEDEKMKKPLVSPLRTRGFPRMVQQRPDLFRSRPPNTSRPPSLHVDDFVALETCGAQPTGPTGYNKISRELMVSRGPRGTRGRAFVTSERAVQYRQMSWWGAGFGRLPY